MNIKMLSEKEAVNFVQDHLEIPNILHKIGENRLDALNQIIKSFQLKIPYQNITLLAKNPGTTGVPSPEEIKSQVLKGEGGLCYTNNVFIHYLLDALGYQVDFISGSFNDPNNHIINHCHLPNDTGSVLVEAACASPTFNVIPLNIATKETLTYTSHQTRYRFVKKEDGLFERQHLYQRNETLTQWECYHTLDLKAKTLDYFQSAMKKVYTESFLTKYRVCVPYEDVMKGLKEGCTNGKDVEYVEFRNRDRKMQELSNDEGIFKKTKSLLPQLDDHLIKDAIGHWKIYNNMMSFAHTPE